MTGNPDPDFAYLLLNQSSSDMDTGYPKEREPFRQIHQSRQPSNGIQLGQGNSNIFLSHGFAPEGSILPITAPSSFLALYSYLSAIFRWPSFCHSKPGISETAISKPPRMSN